MIGNGPPKVARSRASVSVKPVADQKASPQKPAAKKDQKAEASSKPKAAN